MAAIHAAPVKRQAHRVQETSPVRLQTMPIDFEQLPLIILVPLFGAASVAVWLSGAALSRYAELLARRTDITRAFAGLVLLGAATSLPEIATSASASINGHPVLAGNNVLGGIAMQIAVLALVDAFGVRGRALTLFSASPIFLMQGVMLIILLATMSAGIAVGEQISVFRVGLWPLLLMAIWLGALYVVNRYERRPQWEPTREAHPPPVPAGPAEDRRLTDMATFNVSLRFASVSLAVLVSGYVVAETGAGIAQRSGLGESFVGATLVAVATSLPEVSTTFAAVRLGAYSMAAGNIFGANALQMALFLPADVLYREGLIIDELDPQTIFLPGLAIVMTAIYLWGVLEKRDRTVFGVGVDSAVVMVLYLAGMLFYYSLRS